MKLYPGGSTMRDLMPWALVAQRLDEVLSAAELAAITALSDLVDPRRDPLFWERIVARVLGGETTPHQCGWDVEIEGIRVEVKFATGFDCNFANGARRVFKFASLLGAGAFPKSCDVIVLIGYDDPEVFCWVAPYSEMRSRTVTLSHPGGRVEPLGSKAIARFDRYGSSLTQLLPDVCRAYRDLGAAWDRPHRAVSASLTRRLRAGQPDLFAAERRP
ncbi:hypothetical protein MFUR16E_04390 [Methylobacterium fujisawaense]